MGRGADFGSDLLSIKPPRKSALRNPLKGASIYDVHTEGGRGVSPKEDVVRKVA